MKNVRFRSLALIMILFLFSMQLTAQFSFHHNNKKYNIYPELRLLYNMQMLSEKDIENSYGVGFAVFNQWYRFEHFNLIGGFTFNQTSFSVHKVGISKSEYFDNMEYRLNTVGLPIFIRGNIGKSIIVFFETGTIPNFTLSNNGNGIHFYQVVENNRIIPMAESWDKRTNHFKAFDMLFNSNAGIKIPSGNLDFTIGAGVDYGMFKIHKYHNQVKNFFVNGFIGVGLR